MKEKEYDCKSYRAFWDSLDDDQRWIEMCANLVMWKAGDYDSITPEYAAFLATYDEN